MNDESESWLTEDEDPGPLVRAFAITRGRAGTDAYDLDLITLVVAVRPAYEVVTLDYEYREIMRICQQRPLSIAEIAAKLGLLLAAVKVLVSDLIKSGHLVFRSPPPPDNRPDLTLLEAVLDGVRSL